MRESWFFRNHGHVYFVSQRGPDLQRQLRVRIPTAHLHVARAREFHQILRLYSPRPRRQQHDSVGEIDGFVDTVGHVKDGLALALPDTEQFFLEHGPRLRIERTERLIHEQHLWLRG